MAQINNFPITALFLLACGALLITPGLTFIDESFDSMPPSELDDLPPPVYGPVYDVGMEPSSYEFDEPPEPQGFYDHLDKCAEKLTENCGEQLFIAVFKDGAFKPIDDECCHKLVLMGKTCHDDMVNTLILTVKEFKKHASKYYKKSSELWDHCISVVGVVPTSLS